VKKTAFLLLPLIALWLAACASSRLEQSLDPDSRDFLSKVRYLITKQERKTFLNLPAAERKDFIEEFWKSRDPDPATEANEFKDEYFKRIDEANHLFSEGGPGWLQDRGRIYILLGPPSEREPYPRGITFYGKPTEIWYYGFFPIIFIDEAWSGNYRLDPLSANQLAEIMSVQMFLKPAVFTDKKGTLDCEMNVQKLGNDEALARIVIPYKNIWFKSEDKNFQATLEVTIEILNASEKRLWAEQKAFPLSLTRDKLAEVIKEDFVMEIRVPLKPDYALLGMKLTNATDGSRVYKRLTLT
jgi:GWxTD domain-containing protein